MKHDSLFHFLFLYFIFIYIHIKKRKNNWHKEEDSVLQQEKSKRVGNIIIGRNISEYIYIYKYIYLSQGNVLVINTGGHSGRFNATLCTKGVKMACPSPPVGNQSVGYNQDNKKYIEYGLENGKIILMVRNNYVKDEKYIVNEEQVCK